MAHYLSQKGLEFVKNREIHWPGRRGPPPDIPECGFLGNDAKCVTNQTVGMIPYVGGLIFVFALSIIAVIIFVYRFVTNARVCVCECVPEETFGIFEGREGKGEKRVDWTFTMILSQVIFLLLFSTRAALLVLVDMIISFRRSWMLLVEICGSVVGSLQGGNRGEQVCDKTRQTRIYFMELFLLLSE